MFGWRKRTSADFSNEIAAHIALEAERLHGQGLSEAEATAPRGAILAIFWARMNFSMNPAAGCGSIIFVRTCAMPPGRNSCTVSERRCNACVTGGYQDERQHVSRRSPQRRQAAC